MELFPYQREAIAALWDYWRRNPRGAPLLVCPTGSGKSFICASVIQKVNPRFRFLVTTHTKEIVGQNAAEYQKLTSEPVGLYSAGLNSKTIRRVTFANIQSIYKKAIDLHVDILIVDEAHLISSEDTSMYQKLIAALQRKNPRLLIMGLTATPMRMDQGSLVAPGSTFTDVAYDISVRQLIDEGYLSKVISVSKQEVDLTGVKTSGFDYNQGDLEYAFNKEALIDMHCKEIIRNAKDRKHWLIFCSGIDHAIQVTNKFKELGVEADYVTGEMTSMERDTKINRFKDGRTKALCNVGVLTTGFNFRAIDLVGLLRATKSASLYIQAVGRGTRTAPGKSDCLVLDYGGNIERHGPIDMISIKGKKEKKSEVTVAPHKKCPMCGCISAIRASFCPVCEYTYPDNTKELELKASTAAILTKPEIVPIGSRTIKRHKKEGGHDSFRIEYYYGIKSYPEFLCFDHEGFAYVQAGKKWIARGGKMPIPKSVEEAIQRQGELPPVNTIEVIKRGKYFEILSCKFAEKGEKEAAQEKYEKEALF